MSFPSQSFTYNSPSPIAAGSAMLFAQTAAPTGWTKVTSFNDYTIRVVGGSASNGGSVAFTNAFKSQSVSGTNSGGAVSATALSTSQLASHAHTYTCVQLCGAGGFLAGGGSYQQRTCYLNTYSTGCNSAHSHGFTQPTFSGTAINLAVQYVDHIIATKN